MRPILTPILPVQGVVSSPPDDQQPIIAASAYFPMQCPDKQQQLDYYTAKVLPGDWANYWSN